MFGDDCSAGNEGQCHCVPAPTSRPPRGARQVPSHRPPFRHAPPTRRGLLGGAPKEEGLLRRPPLGSGSAESVAAIQTTSQRAEITMTGMTKLFALLLAAFALLATCTAAASAASPGPTVRLATTLLRAASHPRTLSSRPPTAPPCRPTATRHNAMHDDDAVLSRRLSHSPRSRSPPSAHPHRPEPRTGNRPTSGPFRSLNL